MPLKLESCVKPAKQRDVKNLLLAVGIDIEDNYQAAQLGPHTYLETVKEFYAAICISESLDNDSDEGEGTVVSYDE